MAEIVNHFLKNKRYNVIDTQLGGTRFRFKALNQEI